MARQYLPGPADAKKGASLLKPVAPGPLKQAAGGDLNPQHIQDRDDPARAHMVVLVPVSRVHARDIGKYLLAICNIAGRRYPGGRLE